MRKARTTDRILNRYFENGFVGIILDMVMAGLFFGSIGILFFLAAG